MDWDALLSVLAPLHEVDLPVVLGSLLPPARIKAGAALDTLANAPPYVGPGQAVFQRVLLEMGPVRV